MAWYDPGMKHGAEMKTDTIEVLAGHAISAEFTQRRRTDPPDVREAIDRGDFADARWLRCEHQLGLIEDAPTREDRRNRRRFIVASSTLMDMGDRMVQVRPPGSRTH